MDKLVILAGFYKNRTIHLPTKLGVRPTLVRARKFIFDWLDCWKNPKYSFLDVFAGSGIMGMEALSRGASKVVFFEKNRRVWQNLRKNLLSWKVGTHHIIFTNSLCPPMGSPVSVVFIDPPYESAIARDSVLALKKYNWINESTTIIMELPIKNREICALKKEDGFSLIKEIRISKSFFLIYNNYNN